MEKISVKINHKELLVNFWKTDLNNPVGIFFIHHGMAEHINRYNFVAEFLNRNGFHVVGHDHLGHGGNKENGEGIFSAQSGWEKVINEATEISNYFCKLFPNLPTFIYGHSMGGFIAMASAKKIKNLNGIVISGAFLPSKVQLFFIKLVLMIERRVLKINMNSEFHKATFKRLNSFFKSAKTDFDWLSKDTEVVKKYIDDPNCGFNCSNSLWQDFVKGGEMILENNNYEKLNKEVKILLAAGSEDPCIKNGRGIDGLKIFLNKKFNNVRLLKYPGMRHEIQNEQCKENFMSEIVEFIKND